MPEPMDLLQGTLDMLILKAISLGPLHGCGILLRIRQISKDRLEIQQGSFIPRYIVWNIRAGSRAKLCAVLFLNLGLFTQQTPLIPAVNFIHYCLDDNNHELLTCAHYMRFPAEFTLLLEEQGPSSLPTVESFSWTPATMIAGGIVGLILFFFFTANHPKKRAHSLLLEAVRGLRFPTPAQGIDGLLLSGSEFEQVLKVLLATKIPTTFSSQPSLYRVSVHPPDRFLFSG